MSSDRIRLYRVDGIVLRRRDLGEADSIFVLYDDNEGRVEAIAKGVRKIRSHMRGHLEPLARVRLQIARGRSLDVITQAETVVANRHIRANLDRLYGGLYIVDLVEGVTSPGLAHPGLFPLACEALAALEAGLPIANTLRWFEIHFLATLGYEVQLGPCISCRAPLPEAPAWFAPSSGGLLCRNCRAGSGPGREISVRAIKVLRHTATATAESAGRVALDESLDHELAATLAEALHHTLEREPRTRRFLEQRTRHRPTPPPAPQ